jgi:hypothetical protein
MGHETNAPSQAPGKKIVSEFPYYLSETKLSFVDFGNNY